ncbi:MAG: phytanoyl-CoA dioxygenase family protein, partial [Actinomycetota bacterium]|nr:phytanoyl-CoA dioxygenase family protein [Actinomycetota bacterium]
PFEPPFSDSRLWADPTVLGVVERVLGSEFECTYYGSDTPFPGSEDQPVHQDGGPLFPEWESRPPMYCVALNVPLVDVDERNGPFEWVPGTERPGPDARPERFTGPAGSMLLRDTRVWHRGSPNLGDAPRPMLALLYTRDWFRFPLQRPAVDRAVYEELPEPGGRLFRAADITPPNRVRGDNPRLTRDPG